MEQPAESGYVDRPDYRIEIIRRRNRITARFGDIALAETERCLVLDEQDHGLVFYFPVADVRMAELVTSDLRTFCPFKGVASYWSLTGGRGGDAGQDLVWGYEHPYEEMARIEDHVAFYQDRVSVEVGVAPRKLAPS